MAAPTSLLQGARAFARDYPRDAMPRGYLWDVADYVPLIIDAPLTGRGAWRWGSPALDGDIETGILAVFPSGEQLLVQTSASTLYNVGQAPPFDSATPRAGSVYRAIQNPFQIGDNLVLHLDGAGASTPQTITDTAIGTLDASAPKATVGTIWQNFLTLGGGGAFPDTVYFQNATAYTGPWDPIALLPTNGKITGLAGLRSICLVFHAASVERIRGTIPPNGTNKGDLVLENLFQRVGCPDPKAIAYWNENVIFADEHGVHITDGAVTRNLAIQGGISYYWRPLYQNRQTLSACVFLDYYQITIRRSDGIVDTLLCDLNKRQWYRFTNIPALVYISSAGSTGMERVWAGLAGTSRLARIGPCFFPDPSQGLLVDDNGVPVRPTFETPWYRLSPEGRKRVRFVYLSYDVRVTSTVLSAHEGLQRRADFEATPVLLEAPLPHAATQVLDVSYIRSPQETTYLDLGVLPDTDEYTRYRLPIGQQPYGIAFKVRPLVATSALRIFDIAAEAWADERSRG